MTEPQTKWQKWGPWLGPSAIVAVLSLVTSLKGCNSSPWVLEAAMDSVTQRLDAMEAISKAQQAWIDDHRKVAEARIAIQDAQVTDIAVLKKSVSETERRLNNIEAKVDMLVAAGMRKGEIPR